mmetsp:Transcript_15477/g.39441  ORF Transcript_15477/g.39441 Transcript_15477/m.39441 type:complete len:223 (+) Transcript_15477:870-1538(+)
MHEQPCPSLDLSARGSPMWVIVPALLDERSELLRAVLRQFRPPLLHTDQHHDLERYCDFLPRRFPRPALPENHAKAEHVGLLANLFRTEALGAHVSWRAVPPGGVQVRRLLEPGYAEVADLGAAVAINQNVLWLEVPVHDGRVQVRQSGCDLVAQLQNVRVAHLPGSVQLIAEAALHQLHHDKDIVGRAHARAVQLHDVGVFHPGKHIHLPLECFQLVGRVR